MPTNAPEVSLSTDFQTCLIAGSVLRQIASLHHRSPFSLPSSWAQMDFQAMRFGWLTCCAAPCHPCCGMAALLRALDATELPMYPAVIAAAATAVERGMPCAMFMSIACA